MIRCAAPDERHDVHVEPADGGQRGDDGRFAVHPLRAGVGLVDGEAEPARLQLGEEVGVRRAPHARDEPDAQRHRRERTSTVRVEEPVSAESGQRALPIGGETTERERRVDRLHLQLQHAAGPVPADARLDPHLDAVVHPHGATGAPQQVVDEHLLRPAQDHRDRGRRGLPVRGRLRQLEEHVAAGRSAQVTDLALDPDVAGKGPGEEPFEVRAELADPPRLGSVLLRFESRQHARKVQRGSDNLDADPQRPGRLSAGFALGVRRTRSVTVGFGRDCAARCWR